MNYSHNLIIVFTILSAVLVACLKFGDDVELSGQEVNSEILGKVTSLTGVIFPEGTEGRNYLYFGSGIDDALAVKVSIPQDKKEEFLQNEIFISGSNNKPYVQLGKNKNWWKINSLKNPVCTIYNFSNGNMIECAVGEENGETIVYLSWITV
jgi:hypothetical protein